MANSWCSRRWPHDRVGGTCIGRPWTAGPSGPHRSGHGRPVQCEPVTLPDGRIVFISGRDRDAGAAIATSSIAWMAMAAGYPADQPRRHQEGSVGGQPRRQPRRFHQRSRSGGLTVQRQRFISRAPMAAAWSRYTRSSAAARAFTSTMRGSVADGTRIVHSSFVTRPGGRHQCHADRRSRRRQRVTYGEPDEQRPVPGLRPAGR